MSADSDFTRIIISDLHIGRGDKFDIFEADGKAEAFDKFLASCGARGEPVELVINGDFVDFLQLQPWNVYGDKAVALTKITDIVSGSSPVFVSLGKFLEKANHRILVLLGNHDVELAYREISGVVASKILEGIPDASPRLIFNDRVTQYNFHVNSVLAHVEHGNSRDPWNAINYTQLFNDAEKRTGFEYPPGTQFVYDVMNHFKEQYQFVDLLKPEAPAVPLLLARLSGFKAAGALPKASLDLLKAIQEGFLGMVRRAVGGGAFGRTDSLSTEQSLYARMAEVYVDEVTGGDRTRFSSLNLAHLNEFLNKDDLTASDTAAPSLGRRWNAVKNSFVAAILRTLGRPAQIDDTTFYAHDHSGLDVDSAEKELAGEVRIVVFGHTHAALKKEFAQDRIYINSGTWANLIELPARPEQFGDWLKGIGNNTFRRSSFPTYVRLEPTADGALASLNNWASNREVQLWKTVISASR